MTTISAFRSHGNPIGAISPDVPIKPPACIFINHCVNAVHK